MTREIEYFYSSLYQFLYDIKALPIKCKFSFMLFVKFGIDSKYTFLITIQNTLQIANTEFAFVSVMRVAFNILHTCGKYYVISEVISIRTIENTLNTIVKIYFLQRNVVYLEKCSTFYFVKQIKNLFLRRGTHSLIALRVRNNSTTNIQTVCKSITFKFVVYFYLNILQL